MHVTATSKFMANHNHNDRFYVNESLASGDGKCNHDLSTVFILASISARWLGLTIEKDTVWRIISFIIAFDYVEAI